MRELDVDRSVTLLAKLCIYRRAISGRNVRKAEEIYGSDDAREEAKQRNGGARE